METTGPPTASHAHPFVFVDRVLEVEPGKRAVAIKNVTYNEAILRGHYPGQPLMPHTLVLEAMVQVGSIVLQAAAPPAGSEPARSLSLVRNLVFHHSASPGDQLRVAAEVIEMRESKAALRVKATVGNKTIAEGEIVLG